jgi:hypothetical protein
MASNGISTVPERPTTWLKLTRLFTTLFRRPIYRNNTIKMPQNIPIATEMQAMIRISLFILNSVFDSIMTQLGLEA